MKENSFTSLVFHLRTEYPMICAVCVKCVNLYQVSSLEVRKKLHSAAACTWERNGFAKLFGHK